MINCGIFKSSWVEYCRTRSQLDTEALIEWFQSGESNGCRVGNKLASEKLLSQKVDPSTLLSLIPHLGWTGNDWKIANKLKWNVHMKLWSLGHFLSTNKNEDGNTKKKKKTWVEYEEIRRQTKKESKWSEERTKQRREDGSQPIVRTGPTYRYNVYWSRKGHATSRISLIFCLVLLVKYFFFIYLLRVTEHIYIYIYISYLLTPPLG